MNTSQHQLQSIHAMLAAGHRCVQIEYHSLLLIGGVGGLVAGLTEYVITSDLFPDATERAFALLAWLGAWLGGMAATDHVLTQRARRQRDETVPFAQSQITRAWWMLLCMGTLGSFAMLFYGGSAMIYALWMVLLGLGIYLFGLFSQPFVEWTGLATVLLGVTGLAAGLPYGVTHWLAASCFAIGVPMTGWLDVKLARKGPSQCVLALLVWLLMVAGPPLLIGRLNFTDAPDATATEPGTSSVKTRETVLRLVAGTQVPLRINLEGPLLEIDPTAGLAMTARRQIEIALKDGQPDGRYRVDNSNWQSIRDGILELRIDRMTPQLENGQPVVRAHAVFATRLDETAK
jgi:hypothetical protein